MKESEENGRSVNGSNDILVEALGTPEYSGRVRAKGKHHTPRQYFNTTTDCAVRDFIETSQEEHSASKTLSSRSCHSPFRC